MKTRFLSKVRYESRKTRPWPVLMMLVILAATAVSGCAGTLPDSPGSPDAQKTQTTPAGKKIIAAVSIVPQDTFVKAVAGNLVDTVVLIPPGYSPENYAPSPRELIPLSEALLYFSIGVPAEEALSCRNWQV